MFLKKKQSYERSFVCFKFELKFVEAFKSFELRAHNCCVCQMTHAMQQAILKNDPTLTLVELKDVEDIHVVQIASALSSNTFITDLCMWLGMNSDISDDGVTALTNMLRINTSLNRFRLIYGLLGGKAESELVTAAAERMADVDFYKCQCKDHAVIETGPAARALAAVLPTNTTLISLGLSGDYELMDERSQDMLMEALKHNTTLKVSERLVLAE